MAYKEWTSEAWVTVNEGARYALDVAWQYRQDIASLKTEIRTTKARIRKTSNWGFSAVVSLGAGVSESARSNQSQFIDINYSESDPSTHIGMFYEIDVDDKSVEITHNSDGSIGKQKIYGYFKMETNPGVASTDTPAEGWSSVEVTIPGFDLQPGTGKISSVTLNNGKATIKYTSTKACDIIEFRVGSSGTWTVSSKVITAANGSVNLVITCPVGVVSTIYVRHKRSEVSATSTAVSTKADFTIPTIELSKPEEERVDIGFVRFTSNKDCAAFYSFDEKTWKQAGETNEHATDSHSFNFAVQHPAPERAYVLSVYGVSTLNKVPTQTLQIKMYPLVDQLRIRQVYGGKVRVARVWFKQNGTIKKVKYGYSMKHGRLHKLSNNHEALERVLVYEQPQTKEVPYNSVETLSVKAYGPGLTYQWWVNSNSQGWQKSTAAGNKTDTITLTATNAISKNLYRCAIIDQYGNETITQTAAIIVADELPIIILKQPTDFFGTVGDLARFSVEAAGDGLTYAWQLTTEHIDGRGWRDFTSEVYTNPTLSFGITENRAKAYYRCIITDAYGNQVISNEVTITINQASLLSAMQIVPETDDKELIYDATIDDN